MSNFFEQFQKNPKRGVRGSGSSKTTKKDKKRWEKQKEQDKKQGIKLKKLSKKVKYLTQKDKINSQRIEDISNFLKALCQQSQKPRELVGNQQDIPRLPEKVKSDD